MDYLENFEIPELQIGLLSPNKDPYLPPFPHSPLPELNTPIWSLKSTLTAFSLIHSFNTSSPPPMNPIFQSVQEPDITTSNKESPVSILPSVSSSEVESQLQQISAEKPFSPTSKTAENTTLDPSTIPNLLSLASSPLSPPQPPVTQITWGTLLQIYHQIHR